MYVITSNFYVGDLNKLRHRMEKLADVTWVNTGVDPSFSRVGML